MGGTRVIEQKVTNATIHFILIIIVNRNVLNVYILIIPIFKEVSKNDIYKAHVLYIYIVELYMFTLDYIYSPPIYAQIYTSVYSPFPFIQDELYTTFSLKIYLYHKWEVSTECDIHTFLMRPWP